MDIRVRARVWLNPIMVCAGVSMAATHAYAQGNNGSLVDRTIRFESNFRGLRVENPLDKELEEPGKGEKIVPKGARMYIESKDDRTGTLKLIVKGGLSAEVNRECKDGPPTEYGEQGDGAGKPKDGSSYQLLKNRQAARFVCEDVMYSVDADKLVPGYYRQSGWAYGPLFVPFKMRFNDKSLTGEGALGGYFGYETEVLGITVLPIVHAGLSLVTVGGDASTTPNINDTANRSAFTWGGGVIFKPSSVFQFGLIMGSDRIGGNEGRDWKYEGKWWMSIAIGYNFAR